MLLFRSVACKPLSDIAPTVRIVYVLIENNLLHPTPEWKLYKTKKVWSCFAYLTEGCGEPKTNKRCNTPHSNRYEVSQGTEYPYPHSLNKNECCSLSSSFRKLPHFQLRTVRKHFQYVCHADCSTRQDKGMKFFCKQHSN